MPKLPAYLQRDTMLEWALHWAERGWPVVPLHERQRNGACTCNKMDACKSVGKHPRVEGGISVATTDPTRIRQWWAKWPNANIGGATAGRFALDVDLGKGGSWAQVESLPATRRHLSGRGDGGGHLIFTLTAQQRAAGLKSNNTGKWADGIDIKTGPGNYLVLPPSLHGATGKPYTIEAEGEVALPQGVLDRLAEGEREKIESGEAVKGTGGKTRSMLVRLLEKVPERGDGKANDWLIAVCGHYAKQYARQEDLYLLHAREAAAKLVPPLDDAEKAIASAWRMEHDNHPEREVQAQATAETGYLVSNEYEIVCLAWEGPKDDRVQVPTPWADFDLRVKGVIVDPSSNRVAYDLILRRARDRAEIEAVIEAATFGDGKRVATWLAGFGVSVAQPENCAHRSPAPHVKLLRYLQAQEAPQTVMAPALGWDESAEGFLTHEGVITSGGLQPYGTVRPDPTLRSGKSAPYQYGFDRDRAEAQRVLAEVLTYQDETVTSVFGAWWAANLLKPTFMQRVSMFPALAVQAASGAGKTNGAFALMVQASGNVRGEGHYTIASLRNALAGNRNGLIWVDDLDEPRKVHELVRSATSNGTITKVAEDRTTLTEFTLVGSMVLTGEALALSGQKAMVERFVMLNVDSPAQRKSLKPGREHLPQWEDVRDLLDAYPERAGGLAVLAGHFVTMALEHSDEVMAALRRAHPEDGAGRIGEKAQVLRVGAMLLDAILGHDGAWEAAGPHAQRVAHWLADDGNVGRSFEGDNRLTMDILPWALRAFDFPQTPVAPGGGRGAFVEIDLDEEQIESEAVVWFSPKRLAEVWHEYKHGHVDTRTETAESFIEQARQLTPGYDRWLDGQARRPTPATARKQWRTSKHGSGSKQVYWRLEGPAAIAVLRRARGEA
jgi:hypothetical protein